MQQPREQLVKIYGHLVKSSEARELAREMLVSMIVELEDRRRDLSDEISHLRSTLRNDLAGQKWSNDEYTVTYLKGFMTPVPSRRIGNAIAFKRTRLDPYMAVRRKKATT